MCRIESACVCVCVCFEEKHRERTEKEEEKTLTQRELLATNTKKTLADTGRMKTSQTISIVT